MDSDNMNIDLLTRKGDTVYLLFETYEYSDNGSQSTLHLTTMKQDGTVIGTVELPMWKEGEAPATPAPAQGGEASGDGNEAVPLTEQAASTQDIAAADMDVVDAPAGTAVILAHRSTIVRSARMEMSTEYAITIVRHIPKMITAVRMIIH